MISMQAYNLLNHIAAVSFRLIRHFFSDFRNSINSLKMLSEALCPPSPSPCDCTSPGLPWQATCFLAHWSCDHSLCLQSDKQSPCPCRCVQPSNGPLVSFLSFVRFHHIRFCFDITEFHLLLSILIQQDIHSLHVVCQVIVPQQIPLLCVQFFSQESSISGSVRPGTITSMNSFLLIAKSLYLPENIGVFSLTSVTHKSCQLPQNNADPVSLPMLLPWCPLSHALCTLDKPGAEYKNSPAGSRAWFVAKELGFSESLHGQTCRQFWQAVFPNFYRRFSSSLENWLSSSWSNLNLWRRWPLLVM